MIFCKNVFYYCEHVNNFIRRRDASVCLDLNVEVCKSWWWCHFIGLNTKSSCWTKLRVNYKKLKFFSSFHSILIFCWCSIHWLFLPAPSKSTHLTSEWSWRLWGFKRGNVPQNIWIIYLVEWMLMAHEHEGVGVSRGVGAHVQNCGIQGHSVRMFSVRGL